MSQHDELWQLILEQALDAADQAANEVDAKEVGYDEDGPVPDMVDELRFLAR